MVWQQQFSPFVGQGMGSMQAMNRNPYMYNSFMPATTTMNDFQVVNGRESAEMYSMPPNSRVILMDADLPRIYLKQTDAAGGYNLTAYDLVPVEEQVPELVDYITREEFEKWKREMVNEPSTSEQNVSESVNQFADEFSIQPKSDESTIF